MEMDNWSDDRLEDEISQLVKKYKDFNAVKQECKRLAQQVMELSVVATSSSESPAPEEASLPKFLEYDRKMIAIGKAEQYKKSISYWGAAVHISRDEETEELKITSYDQFCDEKINKIPSYMSMDDFKAYFESELRRDYDKAKEEALEQFAQIESE